ncbi:MAG: hypothetical protein DI568_01780 [Sphingomonas sp.]|nr:MAG: hypothetical protein DI568_01780 [Sphingomonas sp.]
MPEFVYLALGDKARSAMLPPDLIKVFGGSLKKKRAPSATMPSVDSKLLAFANRWPVILQPPQLGQARRIAGAVLVAGGAVEQV